MKEILEEIRAGGPVMDILNRHRAEVIRYAAVILVLLTALLLFTYRGSGDLEITDAAETPEASQTQEEERNTDAAPAGTSAESIYVDIGGAVKNPVLAKLPEGSRVEDAILSAGGLKEDADLSAVNRARVLSDGEKIYIPAKGEDPYAGQSAVGTADSAYGTGGPETPAGSLQGDPAAAGRINVNLADKETLQEISGVGPATAQKIIDYRTQNGPFQTPEDLKNVSGIGDKTYEKMKDQITT